MSITLPIFAHLKCLTEDNEDRCRSCRTDPAWRRSLVGFYGGPVDFACPLDKPWPQGYTPSDEAIGEVKPAKPMRTQTRSITVGDPEAAKRARAEYERQRAEDARKPGTILAAAIKAAVGVDLGAGCAVCSERKKQMDQWGFLGCWRNRREILGWVSAEATARGIKVTPFMVLRAIKAAVKQAVKGSIDKGKGAGVG